MLSPGITLMLDRVRSEFGLQTDVLDVNLASALGADRLKELGARGRPELTAAATAAVRQGHASDVAVEGRVFRLLPLHRSDLKELVPLLRRELRESDLVGTLGHDRIVAVLIETDAHAVGAVVRRVRTRLGEAASTKGLPGIAVGEAAFSEECTTVNALLTRAQFNAQVFSSRV